MTRTMVFALSLVLVFALAAPAFAVNGSNGAGRDFGAHHAQHAKEMHGFTDVTPGDMNPGVIHQGFSGWTIE